MVSSTELNETFQKFGGVHIVWVIVFFDLPTETKQQRKQYSIFRKSLLTGGFVMMQYSIYMRHCATVENSEVHVKKVKSALPPDGEVRILKITDKQFSKIEVFYGQKSKPVEKAANQLQFF